MGINAPKGLRNAGVAVLTALGVMGQNMPGAEAQTPYKLVCELNLKSLHRLTSQNFRAIQQRIRGAVPTLRAGNRQQIDSTLRELSREVKTASFLRGSNFFENARGYPGVRIVGTIGGSGGPRLIVQPLDKLAANTSRLTADAREILHGNGTIIRLGPHNKTYLITNRHVLEPLELVDSNLSQMVDGYLMDVALVHLDERDIPPGIQPIRLSQKKDDELVGRPFFIPGIEQQANSPSLDSITVTTGFAMPISYNFYRDAGFGTLDDRTASQTIMHGGLHEDCFENPTGLNLASISGSPTFDFLDREMIGVFSGGPPPLRRQQDVFRFTSFVSVQRILEAVDKGQISITTARNLQWVK